MNPNECIIIKKVKMPLKRKKKSTYGNYIYTHTHTHTHTQGILKIFSLIFQ